MLSVSVSLCTAFNEATRRCLLFFRVDSIESREVCPRCSPGMYIPFSICLSVKWPVRETTASHSQGGVIRKPLLLLYLVPRIETEHTGMYAVEIYI